MSASVAVHPGATHEASLWLSTAVLAAAFIALAAWFAVAVSTSQNSTPSVPHGGGVGQYNQLCVPAPSTNYC